MINGTCQCTNSSPKFKNYYKIMIVVIFGLFVWQSDDYSDLGDKVQTIRGKHKINLIFNCKIFPGQWIFSFANHGQNLNIFISLAWTICNIYQIGSHIKFNFRSNFVVDMKQENKKGFRAFVCFNKIPKIFIKDHFLFFYLFCMNGDTCPI